MEGGRDSETSRARQGQCNSLTIVSSVTAMVTGVGWAGQVWTDLPARAHGRA